MHRQYKFYITVICKLFSESNYMWKMLHKTHNTIRLHIPTRNKNYVIQRIFKDKCFTISLLHCEPKEESLVKYKSADNYVERPKKWSHGTYYLLNLLSLSRRYRKSKAQACKATLCIVLSCRKRNLFFSCKIQRITKTTLNKQ